MSTLRLSIIYTGKIYERFNNPRVLFDAVASMVEDKLIAPSEISIDIYADSSLWIQHEAGRAGVQGIVKQLGIVSHVEALAAQRAARVLWLMKWEDRKNKGVIPGKLFEYMAAGRPILATGGYQDEVSRILEETHTGCWCSTVGEVKDALCDIL